MSNFVMTLHLYQLKLHIINILYFHEEWGSIFILIYLSGVVSEWAFAQWGLI